MAERLKFSSALNATRFGVGLLVMLVHLLPLPLASAGAPDAVLQLLNARNLTSSFFFLLSGFLVAMTATRTGQQEEPIPFAVKRMSRLWPAHAAAFLLMLPADPLRRSAAEAAAWLTMTHGFFPSIAMGYNGPAWAVTSFALGYAVVPFLTRCNDWPLNKLAALALALWLLPLVLLSALLFTHSGVWDCQIVPRLAMPPQTELLQRFLHSSPLFRVPEVLCGAVAALAARRTHGASGERILLWLIPAMLAGLFIVGGMDDRWLFFFTHGAVTPLLLLVLAALWRSDGWLESLCARPWLRRGGQSGILIYFLHRPVFRMIDVSYRLWSGATVHQTERSLTMALAAAAVTVAVAFFIQPGYDAKCKRLAAWLLERKPAAGLAKAEVAGCAH